MGDSGRSSSSITSLWHAQMECSNAKKHPRSDVPNICPKLQAMSDYTCRFGRIRVDFRAYVSVIAGNVIQCLHSWTSVGYATIRLGKDSRCTVYNALKCYFLRECAS